MIGPVFKHDYSLPEELYFSSCLNITATSKRRRLKFTKLEADLHIHANPYQEVSYCIYGKYVKTWHTEKKSNIQQTNVLS